jgi:phage terminase small subunit
MSKREQAPGSLAKLTARQQRFVEEYLVDLNATKAAERAGYSPRAARMHGSRLMMNDDIAGAIFEAQQARARRTDITADRVVQELAVIAFSDLGEVFDNESGTLRMRRFSEMSEHVRRALESVREQPTEKGVILSVKLHSKVAALKMLADHLGMDAPKKVRVDGNLGMRVLTPEMADEIRRKILGGGDDDND